jgi:hypothetical protein
MRRMLLLSCVALTGCGARVPTEAPAVTREPDGQVTADYWNSARTVILRGGPGALEGLDGRENPFTPERAATLERAALSLRTLPAVNVDEEAVACVREASELLLAAARYGLEFGQRIEPRNKDAWLARRNEQRSRKQKLVGQMEAWQKKTGEAQERFATQYKTKFADLAAVLSPATRGGRDEE